MEPMHDDIFSDPHLKEFAAEIEETHGRETVDETLARIEKERKAREAKKEVQEKGRKKKVA